MLRRAPHIRRPALTCVSAIEPRLSPRLATGSRSSAPLCTAVAPPGMPISFSCHHGSILPDQGCGGCFLARRNRATPGIASQPCRASWYTLDFALASARPLNRVDSLDASAASVGGERAASRPGATSGIGRHKRKPAAGSGNDGAVLCQFLPTFRQADSAENVLFQKQKTITSCDSARHSNPPEELAALRNGMFS